MQFRQSGVDFSGHITRKMKKHCEVVIHRDYSVNVAYDRLFARENGSRRRVLTRLDKAKATVDVGDRVMFSNRDKDLWGKVSKLNPTRAVVDCDNNERWRVSYMILTVMSRHQRAHRIKVLEDVAARADVLIDRHRLDRWSFQFDDASKRAGQCQYELKVISLARQYCLEASQREWNDTILHEIAHALVGPEHHHDAEWRRVAQSIGCTAERCHSVSFTQPRYILRCPRCNWANTRMRRKRNMRCRTCKSPPVYEPFSAERWRLLKKRPRQGTSGPGSRFVMRR